jgi:hypothetical protein
MLSSLSASLLPASFGSLFSPPLDGEQLHVSLTRGGRVALGPPALQIDAQRFNALLLPSPRAPMRLVRGELGALELSMDWKAFFSQPLKLVVRGLHLCLAPAHIRRPSTAAAGKQEQEQGEAWKESDLLEVAEEAKRTLLEALLPAGPSLLDSLKAKAAEGNNKGGWLSAPLKKLVAWVLDSLNLQVEDVHIEFMLHEDEGRAPSSGITTGEEVAGASQAEVIKAAEEVEERKGPQQLAESMAASVQAAQPSTASPSPVAMTSATSAHAPVSAPVTFGIELKRCIMQDTVKVEQQEVPSEYDNTKDMHVGLAVYCDTEASSRPVGASAAKGDVGEKEERKREEPSSAQTAPKHGHDYIIEPMAASMHIAFLSNFSEQMRMQARLICKDVQSSLHPAQLKGLAAIVAAIMANQTALYDEAEKVGARRFRSATPKDQEQYCRLIKKRMQGRKLSSNEESALDKMEKEIVLKDLLNMRAEVDKQLHVAKQIQEEQEASEASSSTTSPSVTPSDTPTHAAAEQREPSLWESAKLFFSDAVSRDAESTGATASSGGEEVKESSSLISGVGTLQSALEQASPFTLDVRVEAVAEEVRFVLFEDASKSVESALLALSLTDGALRAEVHPGGALSVKLGVKQITLADATQLVKHDKPELPRSVQAKGSLAPVAWAVGFIQLTRAPCCSCVAAPTCAWCLLSPWKSPAQRARPPRSQNQAQTKCSSCTVRRYVTAAVRAVDSRESGEVVQCNLLTHPSSLCPSSLCMCL